MCPVKFVSVILSTAARGVEKRMVHRSHAGVVDEHIQPAVVLSDLREHSLDRRFVATVEAVVPIVREFLFQTGTGCTRLRGSRCQNGLSFIESARSSAKVSATPNVSF